jgi:hypothetical protein
MAILFAGRDIEYPTRSCSHSFNASSFQSIEFGIRAQDRRSDRFGGCARHFVLAKKQPTPFFIKHPVGFGR